MVLMCMVFNKELKDYGFSIFVSIDTPLGGQSHPSRLLDLISFPHAYYVLDLFFKSHGSINYKCIRYIWRRSGLSALDALNYIMTAWLVVVHWYDNTYIPIFFFFLYTRILVLEVPMWLDKTRGYIMERFMKLFMTDYYVYVHRVIGEEIRIIGCE